jgi:uncharacterized Zn-binding protein involved in type VI secretion
MTELGKYISNGAATLPGYPNPAYYLGAFFSDPTNTSSGQWWYNITTMELKENINGSILTLNSFASSFSSTIYITTDTTIGGSGITVNYINLVISNNATLTVASGTTVNVAGVLNIMPGSTLILNGATLNVYNTLQNAGTLQSTSSSDSIEVIQLQNAGNIQINGTLYLPNTGYNHILAGSISGSGTLNIQGTALTLTGDTLQLSVSKVTGNGTYIIQQNAVCSINGNIKFSVATVTGGGTLSFASNYILTIDSNVTFSIPTITGSGTLFINTGYTLTIASNTTMSIPMVRAGTLSVASGYTLTIASEITFDCMTLTGQGSISFGSNQVIVQNDVTWSIAGLSGSGHLGVYNTLTLLASYTFSFSSIFGGASSTIQIGSGYTLTASTSYYGSVTITGSDYNLIIRSNTHFYNVTISGSGTLSVASGYTLLIESSNISISNLANGIVINSMSSTIQGISLPDATYTVYDTQTITADPAKNIFIPSGQTVTVGASFTTSSNDVHWLGTGTLEIVLGYTLTIGSNVSFRGLTVSGAGTLEVASGYTLSIPSNTTFSISTITGLGTLKVSGTLTQGSDITISISNISVFGTITFKGTWANAGYGITIPSGATVTWNVSGSITTSSTPGTLTVNGTCYWIGGIPYPSGDSQISFPLRFAGTGIFIGAPAGQGSGSSSITFSSTSIDAGSNDGSTAASGGIPYYTFSSIQGSAVGKYTLGIYNSSKSIYNGFVIIYIGTANTSYTVSGSFGRDYSNTTGDTFYARNMTGSAGTITLTGTLYV